MGWNRVIFLPSEEQGLNIAKQGPREAHASALKSYPAAWPVHAARRGELDSCVPSRHARDITVWWDLGKQQWAQAGLWSPAQDHGPPAFHPLWSMCSCSVSYKHHPLCASGSLDSQQFCLWEGIVLCLHPASLAAVHGML